MHTIGQSNFFRYFKARPRGALKTTLLTEPEYWGADDIWKVGWKTSLLSFSKKPASNDNAYKFLRSMSAAKVELGWSFDTAMKNLMGLTPFIWRPNEHRIRRGRRMYFCDVTCSREDRAWNMGKLLWTMCFVPVMTFSPTYHDWGRRQEPLKQLHALMTDNAGHPDLVALIKPIFRLGNQYSLVEETPKTLMTVDSMRGSTFTAAAEGHTNKRKLGGGQAKNDDVAEESNAGLSRVAAAGVGAQGGSGQRRAEGQSIPSNERRPQPHSEEDNSTPTKSQQSELARQQSVVSLTALSF